MKLVGISVILSFASAGKIVVDDAQDATVLATSPKYVYHPDYVSDDYYNDLWHNTISLEEVPNAGENIFDICNGIKGFNEGWCPKSTEQAKRVYSELVVQHFMPNSLAAGVLDESEVSNIPTSFMLGYRVNNWANPPLNVPPTIDNFDARVTRGTGADNDVYECGPRNGVRSGTQTLETPTIGFADATASAPNHCTTIGNLGFYGNDFDKNFKLMNADCATTSYVLCTDIWAPSGTSHSGHEVSNVQLSSTSVDIIKAAFDLLNDPNSSLNAVEEEENTTTNNSGNTGSTTDNKKVTKKSKNKVKISLLGFVFVVIVMIFFVKKKE